MKKLILNKEIVRNLDQKTLKEIHGGARTGACTAKAHACLWTDTCPTYLCP